MNTRNKSDIRVLVVDDEENLRDSIIFDLKRKGFTVFSAGNGKDAFEVVKAEKIDLVISDLRMPGGDGLALLGSIRSEMRSGPAVIFMTGFADVAEPECLERGAEAVVAKPFERSELLAAVMKALRIAEG